MNVENLTDNSVIEENLLREIRLRELLKQREAEKELKKKQTGYFNNLFILKGSELDELKKITPIKLGEMGEVSKTLDLRKRIRLSGRPYGLEDSKQIHLWVVRKRLSDGAIIRSKAPVNELLEELTRSKYDVGLTVSRFLELIATVIGKQTRTIYAVEFNKLKHEYMDFNMYEDEEGIHIEIVHEWTGRLK